MDIQIATLLSNYPLSDVVYSGQFDPNLYIYIRDARPNNVGVYSRKTQYEYEIRQYGPNFDSPVKQTQHEYDLMQ